MHMMLQIPSNHGIKDSDDPELIYCQQYCMVCLNVIVLQSTHQVVFHLCVINARSQLSVHVYSGNPSACTGLSSVRYIVPTCVAQFVVVVTHAHI